MADKKQTSKALQPTSFTEINRIHRHALDKAKKGSLILTSSSAGEGVTTLAHTMAVRNADNGERTLLVDLNMRDSALSELFGAERNEWKLAERDMETSLLDLCVQVEGVNNLFLLSAPRDDDSVQFLRDAERARKFLENLEKEFDHVVVDTTPVQAFNRYNVDPVLLSTAATKCILVYLAGETSKYKAQKSLEQLKGAGAEVEGMIINDFRNPNLQEELFNLAERLGRVSPSLEGWLKKGIRSSKIFN